MTPTNDLPPGLYLQVASEPWDEPCPECEDGVTEERERTEYSACGEPIDRYTECVCCEHCHGTGKRKVRLVGMVRGIIIDAEGQSRMSGWLMVGGKEYCKTREYKALVFSSDPREAYPIYNILEELQVNIIVFYRAGTLPPALLAAPLGTGPEWGLRIKEVQNDD